MKSMLSVFIVNILIILSGCSKESYEVLDIGKLPDDMKVNKLGSIGLVYKIKAKDAKSLIITLPENSTKNILSKTIRLYHYQSANKQWKEVAGSVYNPAQRTITITNPVPNDYYSAFGWSANPALNALQRRIFDWRNNFKGDPSPQPSIQAIANQSNLITLNTVLAAYNVAPPVTFRLCRGLNCAAVSGCGGLFNSPSCPLNNSGDLCDENQGCCSCQAITIPGGSLPDVVIPPVSFFEKLPICVGRPICPICPNALSCPNSPFLIDAIKPPQVPVDYRFLNEVGLSFVFEDKNLLNQLHVSVEQTLGEKYPKTIK